MAEVWDRMGMESSERDELVIQECDEELDAFREMLPELSKLELGRLFPNLETIAISSIYGDGDLGWRTHDRGMRLRVASKEEDTNESDEEEDSSKPMWRVRHSFRELLATAPKSMTNVCVRQMSGPLYLPNYPTRMDSICPSIIHFGPGDALSLAAREDPEGDGEGLPFVAGGVTSWVSDYPSSHSWDGIIVDTLAPSIRGICGTRKTRWTPLGPIDLTIYFSSPFCSRPSFKPRVLFGAEGGRQSMPPPGTPRRILTPKRQREMAANLEEETKRLVKVSSEAHDPLEESFSWRCSSETPLCPACGSGVPA